METNDICEKMSKNVAIISLYYKNLNYGALLQSYALCEKVQRLGFCSKQISYNLWYQKEQSKFTKLARRCWNLLHVLNFRKLSNYLKNNKVRSKLRNRIDIISKFSDKYIPHTEHIYNSFDIKECIDDYDIFVTGSDQVWNFAWYVPAYFLDFVPSQKTKISYAASLSMNSIDQSQQNKLKVHLSDFNAISVREQDAVGLLQELTPKQVQWVLDPTLLLDKKDWDEICAERTINEPYVFCYFLGEDCEQTIIAEEFARKHGLKLATIPYLTGRYIKRDKKFGDIRLFDIGPQEFLSLIKYADFVLTDSFHAMVFSGIYKKQYFVFQRNGYAQMSSRIYSLCELYETIEHFCDTPEKTTLEYIESVSPINYEKPLEKLSQMKEKSLNYLKESLK